MKRHIWAFACCAAAAWAGSAEDDWTAVTALDAGPPRQARTATEAQVAIIAHIGAQEKALRGFLTDHATDEHSFEARLRLARLLALRGEIQTDPKSSAEAARLLDSLETSATTDQRVELEFARITQAMRQMSKPTATGREQFLARVQKFQATHPDDRRLAALLTEVATLFDLHPKVKQQLLLDARKVARDEELNARISDDLRRIELVGQPLALAGPAPDGRAINVERFRNRLVIVCFFAAWSQPSTEALGSLQRAAASFPKDRVQLLGVSLDTKPDALAALLKEKAIAWPVICDGLGWESPLVRGLGINSLPTVWLLDRTGKLRSLNALENPGNQVSQLLNER